MAYTPATVNAWYQAVQFRDGPAATVASTVALLNSGTITPATAQNSIINDTYTTTYVNPMLRIYQAAFNRVPDAAGQNFWTDNFAAGNVTTQTAANEFANSPEFIAQYGANASAPINAAVLTAFYANVLNRAPDAAGFEFWLNSGQNVGQVLNFFAQSQEFTVASGSATNQFQQAQINGNAATSGSLFQYGGFPGTTYILTTNLDTATAHTFNGSVGGSGATFTPGDALTGSQLSGNSLNLTDLDPTTALTTADISPVTATLSNIQNLTLASSGAFGAGGAALSTAGALFSGVANVTGTASGLINFTAGATQAVNITNANQGVSTVDINGAKSVTLTTSTTGAVNSGAINVGTAGPIGSGAISIVTNNALGDGNNAGPIAAVGGSTVSITQNALNAVNTSINLGAVNVAGTLNTTSVTVNQTAAATKSATVAGVVNGSVTINDANAGSTTAVGTITSANINGYNGIAFNGTSLSSLNVANGLGNVIINNSGLTTPVTKTLALSIDNVSSGTLDDADIYTTLNVKASGKNSTLSNITFGGATALNIDGSSVLTLTSTAGMTALKTVSVAGSAGVTADFTGATITSVNSSGSSGTVKVAIDATKATFSGGSGSSTVTLATAAPTKAIAAGSGTADTLVISAANAATASGASTFASFVTGFENLTLTGSTNQTVALDVLGNYKNASTSGGNGLTLNGFAGGGTLTLTAAGTAYTLANPNWAAGTADAINIALTDGSGAAVAFASTGITASGLESVAISVTDTQAIPSGTFNDTLTLLGNSLKNISVSGNAGLTLTAASTALTSLDASGITLGGFQFTSGALAGAATINGSASGTNTVTASAATKAVTYFGGTGSDVVTINNAQNNVVSLGDGANSFTGGNGNNTVTGGSFTDTITVGNGANTINTSLGNDVITVGTGANTINTGDGNDTVNVGATSVSATNTVTFGVGTATLGIVGIQASAGNYTAAVGFNTGDKVDFTTANGTQTAGTLGAAVSLGAAATWTDYLNAATAGNGSTTSIASWFVFQGNTFVTLDNGAGSTFTAGTDQVVQLTGTYDLTSATIGGAAGQALITLV